MAGAELIGKEELIQINKHSQPICLNWQDKERINQLRNPWIWRNKHLVFCLRKLWKVMSALEIYLGAMPILPMLKKYSLQLLKGIQLKF